mgnify:CR=1 FL=1|jgi:hypothetical protein
MRRESVEFGEISEITERRRARFTLDSIFQASLTRSINLIIGFTRLLGLNNTHSLALLARGHFETTALLGFLCDQLIAYEKARLTFEDLHDKIAAAMLGHSGSDFPDVLKPINVMTMIEKADRYLKSITDGQCSGLILDSYGWLSNFGHPNSLSSVSSFRLDREKGAFVFGDRNALKDNEKEFMNYLLLSTGIQSTFLKGIGEIGARVDF